MEFFDDKFNVVMFGSVCTIFGILISSALLRGHKIIEFRQNWINSLRIIFYDTMDQVEKYLEIAYKGDIEEVYIEKVKLLSQIYKIKMHMNRKEKMYLDLIELLENLQFKYKGFPLIKTEYELDKKITTEIITVMMQDILKNEWDRVRDGEYQTMVNKMKNWNSD